jgi:hypothetical protein
MPTLKDAAIAPNRSGNPLRIASSNYLELTTAGAARIAAALI